MIASVLIIAFSVILFLYWFRYSCLLLLRSHGEQPSEEAAQYITIRQALQNGAELDPLHRSLERDYQVLTYLLDHAKGLELQRLEYRLLVLDYRMMQFWYRITRSSAPQMARRALSEMADVLHVLVEQIGPPAGIRNSRS